MSTDAEPAAHDGADRQSIGPNLELPQFSGPLDLLLHLVRRNKVPIEDIPLALVCDQYHDHLRQMQELDLDVAAEFLWMASWLLYAKSKTLLPVTPSTKDEPDPRTELVERLLEYRRVKEVAGILYDREVVRRCLWQAEVPAGDLGREEEVDLEDLDLRTLARCYLTVMDRFASAHPPPLQVTPLRFTVEQKMKEIYTRVHDEGSLPLLRHLDSRSDSEEVVALVVATLELVRLGGIAADQRRAFAEIYLRPGRQPLDPTTAFATGREEPSVN
jgi:segregation and condensation protein A